MEKSPLLKSAKLISGLALVLGAISSCVAQESVMTYDELRADNPQFFPDFGFMVSESEYFSNYSDQPLFRIKTDYPDSMPPRRNLPGFMRMDFRNNPEEYLLAVRDYAFEGNLPDWNPHTNTVREWYHIPWLHPNSDTGFPPNGGTEGFHGLIKEAPVSPYQLAATQTGSYQVYAITLINDFAGYTMHEMWKNPDLPDPRATDKRFGGGFPQGAVFAKLLFTDAPAGEDTVPFLQNPIEWDAYITESWNSPNRMVKKVHLLQMDIMVRDSRVDDTTGWILGTFTYNGQAGHANRFENLIPLGLIWGNDPQDRANVTNPFPPTDVNVNPNLRESIVLDTPQTPPQHLGWNSRLNGPADLNTTSCISCHMVAEFPALTPLVPPNATPDGGVVPPRGGGSDAWMKWFQNQPAATPMDPRAYSADFSLQVVISLQNFFAVKGQAEQGIFSTSFNGTGNDIRRGVDD